MFARNEIIDAYHYGEIMSEKKDDSNSLQLDRIAFYGRTLEEYTKIFNIEPSLMKGLKVLDCPAGPSSFVAEANKLEIRAVGCDPLFGNELDDLIFHGKIDIEHVIDRVSLVSHLYNWDFYSSINGLKEYRMVALQQFQEDYQSGILKNRYIKAGLPNLPFEDKSFDLVLSGHFLFLYSNKLDYKFHLSSILELYRVSSNEVRIYPIQGPDARPYAHMKKLLADVRRKGIEADILPDTFMFQRGSNGILRLTHRRL